MLDIHTAAERVSGAELSGRWHDDGIQYIHRNKQVLEKKNEQIDECWLHIGHQAPKQKSSHYLEYKESVITLLLLSSKMKERSVNEY